MGWVGTIRRGPSHKIHWTAGLYRGAQQASLENDGAFKGSVRVLQGSVTGYVEMEVPQTLGKNLAAGHGGACL